MLQRRVLVPGMLVSAVLYAAPAGAQGTAASDGPFEDYMQAAALLRAGRLDQAVYPFYRGQLRARIYLLAHPDLPPDGAPAAFASLNAVLGEPINRYAFGDLLALLATLDRVLAWHAAQDDPWTPKARFPEAHAQVVAGLMQMREYVATQGETIRAQRRANGLPNRR